MAASISSSVIACLKSFNEFIEDITHLQKTNVRGPVAGPWEDELGRLRVWAANIGAHQTGQSSLDYRLRDASHVRDQIIKLLRGLLRRLQDARDVLAEDDESEDEDAADNPLDEEDPKTEIQELQESLATNINCLFQMSMLVRKPAQHDVYLGSTHADVAAFELFDYNHVREKFPQADDALVKRLGNAITRRRKYLKYRERHATKLKQGISNVDPSARDYQDVEEGDNVGIGMGSILFDTIATEFEQRNIDFEDKASDTGISQTSFAPTLLVGGHVAIPPPPKTSLGRVPFECPYCFYVITINGARSWNRHVFQDLQPYICISPTCTTPDKLYTTRHEWLHHLCMTHPADMTDDDAPKESRGLATCHLCKGEIEAGRNLDRHLARHLQELALFILPGGEEESSVDENQDSEFDSDAESIHLSTSRKGSESAEDLPASSVEHPAAIDGVDSLYAGRRQEEDEDEDNTTESGDLKDRLTHVQKEVEERQRLLGQDHPDTLVSMSELAELYFYWGRNEEAVDIGRQVMETRERVLGEEHPETLRSMKFMALLLTKTGDLEEAEEMYQETIDGYEKAFGRDHPNTLSAVYEIGRVYEKMGKLTEAEETYLQVLSKCGNKSSYDHAIPHATAYVLVNLYEQQGRLAEAEALSERMFSFDAKELKADQGGMIIHKGN